MSVRQLGIIDLRELPNVNQDLMYSKGFGPVETANFLRQLQELFINPIKDFKVMTALNIPNVGEETWKKILAELTIKDLISMNLEDLNIRLQQINSVGKKTAYTITSRMPMVKDIYEKFIFRLNVVDYKSDTKKLPPNAPVIVITGFRDDSLKDKFADFGYKATYNSVTNNTFAVIAANPNDNSSKIKDARTKGIPIYTLSQFVANYIPDLEL